ncbi:Phosphate-specific outer membrane porin OprP; Pyrophosphate-specific outer membrane porin OprO [hydrothermal vent metagenome]|uniref:Phosphate-specific outer membrane porin OprP Pyrophosphate-specific outer membrane porin OprO n=1 Tax=hydrothermal vent metagenome TaxID=652676 RepID=A0A1W1C8S2_9ZZZZ
MKKVIIMCSFLLCAHASMFERGQGKFEAGGQIVADTAWIDDNGDTYHDSKIRRARVYLKGDITKFFSYEIEYSFTGKNDWKDVYLKYTGLPGWMIYAGNIKEPFGLEAITSSKYNTFMERALADFYNSRKIGLLIKGYQKNDNDVITYALGGFDKSLDETIDHKKGDSSLVGRVTYAKIISKKEIYHLGLSASYTAHDKDSVKLSSDIGSSLYQGSFIKTKVKKVDHTKRIGIESAMVSGAFSFQGEYVAYAIAKQLITYNFSGWYAQASWFLTGETRKYKAKTAVFSRVKPLRPVNKGGYGAVEVAFRVTQLDLSDKDENGGKERDLSLGVNWYLKSNLRLMAEYTYADELSGRSKDANIFQLRAQYDF